MTLQSLHLERQTNSKQAKKKTRSSQKIWRNVKGLTWQRGITNDTIKMTQEGNQTRRWKMEWREGVLPDRTDNFCNTLPRLLKEDGKESDPSIFRAKVLERPQEHWLTPNHPATGDRAGTGIQFPVSQCQPRSRSVKVKGLGVRRPRLHTHYMRDFR